MRENNGKRGKRRGREITEKEREMRGKEIREITGKEREMRGKERK